MGSSPVARRYWGNHFCFLFLRVLRCFSSPGSPPPLRRMAVRQTAGLPHSGTPGSMTACVSPGLFAACRALHRLPEPQASAVRPFLLSAQPPRTWRGGRIPSERRLFHSNPHRGPCRGGGRRTAPLARFSLLFHHVNEQVPTSGICGEYRNRTDDLLHAMQAL